MGSSERNSVILTIMLVLQEPRVPITGKVGTGKDFPQAVVMETRGVRANSQICECKILKIDELPDYVESTVDHACGL